MYTSDGSVSSPTPKVVFILWEGFDWVTVMRLKYEIQFNAPFNAKNGV